MPLRHSAGGHVIYPLAGEYNFRYWEVRRVCIPLMHKVAAADRAPLPSTHATNAQSSRCGPRAFTINTCH